ncbi:hypothetical protein [Streptomyces sp. NPDC048644]|uniref:hypothetical protein n=1 Tax=Streptomyces sp. NPDC048644 TaxID=3365582 RepID=UPI00371F2DF9
MPDRHRRAALLIPLPATIPGAVLLPRDATSSSPSPDASGPSRLTGALRSSDTGSSGGSGSSGTGDGSGSSESAGPEGDGGPGKDRGSPDPTPDEPAAPDRDNPFAPPPADTPDQEWRPRHQHAHSHHGDDGQTPGDEQPPAWGSQWSSKQPGRQGGGFGTRPGRSGQQGGGQGGPGTPGGLRWDPTDPAQRRARYALLGGMWAFFFVLFNLPEVALLLGALAIYWGISSLRAKPGSSAKAKAAATTAAMEGLPAPSADGADAGRGSPYGAPAPGGPAAPQSTRPQTTAAISGLVVAGLALMMVAATFAVQLVYRDYFTCVDDALTQSAAKSCEKLLPEQLRPLLSVQE